MAKLRSERGGTARILVILSLLILVMVVVLSIPSWKEFRYRSQCIACEQAIKSANDGLKIEYLDTYDESSVIEARRTLDRVMPAREDICPTHGNVYMVRNEQGIFELICGLHNPDAARRTRLNASYAGKHLDEARKDILEKAEEGDPEPEKIRIKVNGRPLDCVYVTENVNIRRGTSTTKDYDGTVAFYGTDDDNEISYFVYADEDHCAIWEKGEGWRGDAYDS